MPVTDNFNRANSGTLGANWTNFASGIWVTGGFQIVSNKAEPLLFGVIPQVAYYSGTAFGNAQYSQAVCADDPYYMGLVVAALDSGGAVAGYVLQTGRNPGTMTLSSAVNAGAGSSLTTFGSVYPVAGDTIRLEKEPSGGNVLLRAYLNGSQVGSTYTDSTILLSGGSPGLFGNYTGFDDFDSWEGGDLGGLVVPSRLSLLGVS